MILGIQYLRAIAALMVVFHHARNYFRGHHLDFTSVGASGVDIFFVISGFVMAYSTQNFDNNRQLGVQATHFLQNRIVRIVPLYWLATLWQARGEIINGAITSGLVGDFFFIPRFLPPDNKFIWPILVPGWTLNYEMFFYAIFGIAMLKGKARYLIMFMVFVTLALLGLFIHSGNALVSFYTSPLPLEFMFGVLLYKLRNTFMGRLSRNAAVVVLVAGFAVLAIENGFMTRVVADGIPAVFIVGSAIVVFNNVRLPLLRLLGDASYSIYITHVFALEFAMHLADRLRLNDPTPVNVLLALGLQLMIATIVGVVIHKAVEKPVTSFLQTWIRKRQANALAPA
jgi:exopolysaccharide production protein ExoZ